MLQQIIDPYYAQLIKTVSKLKSKPPKSVQNHPNFPNMQLKGLLQVLEMILRGLPTFLHCHTMLSSPKLISENLRIQFCFVFFKSPHMLVFTKDYFCGWSRLESFEAVPKVLASTQRNGVETVFVPETGRTSCALCKAMCAT